eukprot:jgi/Chlat1/3601/Chrsp234S03575
MEVKEEQQQANEAFPEDAIDFLLRGLPGGGGGVAHPLYEHLGEADLAALSVTCKAAREAIMDASRQARVQQGQELAAAFGRAASFLLDAATAPGDPAKLQNFFSQAHRHDMHGELSSPSSLSWPPDKEAFCRAAGRVLGSGMITTPWEDIWDMLGRGGADGMRSSVLQHMLRRHTTFALFYCTVLVMFSAHDHDSTAMVNAMCKVQNVVTALQCTATYAVPTLRNVVNTARSLLPSDKIPT